VLSEPHLLHTIEKFPVSNNPPAKPGAFIIEPLKGVDKTVSRRKAAANTASPFRKGGLRGI
jgi:hypothetical protein